MDKTKYEGYKTWLSEENRTASEILAELDEAIELIEFKMTSEGQEALEAIGEPEDVESLAEALMVLQGERAHAVEHDRHLGRVAAQLEDEYRSSSEEPSVS